MLRHAPGVVQGRYRLIASCHDIIDFGIASPGLRMLGLLTAAALGGHFRKDSALIGRSIAAVIERMTFNQRHHDNTKLLNPWVRFGRITLEKDER
jgi:hypothetical protein